MNLKFGIQNYFFLILIFTILFLFGCLRSSLLTSENLKNNITKKLELVDFEPGNNATSIMRNAKIILKFNYQLDSSTLSFNTKNNQCSGTIQITANNFRSCVKIKSIDLEEKDKKIILIPKGVYHANTFHKIRLTDGIKAKNGTSLKNFISSPGFRTTWSQQIGTSGDDSGFAVSVDKEQNIYLAGLTSAGEKGDKKDIFLAKYVPSGFRKWITQPGFGRSVTKVVLSIKKSNQISLSAFSKDQKDSSVIITSYSFDGKKKFSKTIKLGGNVSGNGLTLDKDGNFYVTAATPFNVLKIGAKGKKLWGTELGKRISIRDIASDTGNGLYITGSIKKSSENKNSKSGQDVFLLKISQMGPKLWNRTIESPLDELSNSIAIQSDKAVAIVGYISKIKNFKDAVKKTRDAFVTKYNSKGELEWTHIFSGENSEQSTVALWTPEGDLLVGGFTESILGNGNNSGKEDVFLAKLDNNGKLLWIKQFGSKENERPLGLALGNKGQIFVTGYSEGQIDGAKLNGGRDIFLVKYNKDGEKQ